MSLQPPTRTRLFEVIRGSGLKQSQVSQLSGLSQSRLSRLCRGKSGPTDAELRQLALALGVEPGRLFDPLANFPEEERRAARAAAWFQSEDGQFFLRGLFAAALAE